MPAPQTTYRENLAMSVDPLVSTAWLAEHLEDPEIRVVDMRGHVTTKLIAPGVEEALYRGARDEYLAGHIPGAVYVDWTTDIIDPEDSVPAQIAPAARFAEAMAAIGVGDQTHVVAVDHMGGQFATRLWWALTYYGHPNVSVVNGGWNRWRDEGRASEAGLVTPPRSTFTPRPDPQWRRTAEQVLVSLGDGGIHLIDARDEAQYTGAKRRGPRGGHIPGAVNLPRELFFAPEGGFRPLDTIRRDLEERGISPDRPIVGYCNGGVAA